MMKKIVILLALIIAIFFVIKFVRFILGYKGEMYPNPNAISGCAPINSANKKKEEFSQDQLKCYTFTSQGQCESAESSGKCAWINPL